MRKVLLPDIHNFIEEAISDSIKKIQHEQKVQGKRIQETEQRVSSCEDQLAVAQAAIARLQKDNQESHERIEDLENRPRRSNSGSLSDASGNTDHSNTDSRSTSCSSILAKANKRVSKPLMQTDIAIKLARASRKCYDCKWPKNNGIVYIPYNIPSDYYEANKNLMLSAMKEFASMTCVQFISQTTETDYVYFVNRDGCWGFIGKTFGAQPINLDQSYCMVYGVIQHELMHAMGFLHEHTRIDRDQYLHINWQYISPGDKPAMELDNPEKADTHGIPYDYSSVMHYDRWVYSNTSGEDSMVPIPDSTVTIGQMVGLSSLDVRRINDFYSCSKFIATEHASDNSSTITGLPTVCTTS
ncbi:hatching enzyme 1.2-like [Hyperolius riggenbachi]|uniref:hatching enzyme 1.2-like n=1 Tax=Hyperolius riggenbachi TaxID=752182 RepID=UPI0035A3B7D6